MRAVLPTLVLLLNLMQATATALEGQRVLVTGGGRGIGRAIALLCASEGAKHVAVIARNTEELASVVAEGGSCMLSRTADVTDEAAVDEAVKSIAAEMGGIDVLINNAGGASVKGPLHEQSASAFRQLLDLNVVSVMIVSSAVVQHAMLAQGSGRIINVSSRAGKVGLANMGPYVASKFAVEGLTATMAAELEGKVRVNSISPGMVDTKSFPKAAGRPGVRSAESIRDGLLLLLSEEGGSGNYLHVDELDEAVAAGTPEAAVKPINEPVFACAASF